MEQKCKRAAVSGNCGYRKNPQAPRRFKSPYILFSISKMQEFKQSCKTTNVTSFSSQISREWKALSENEREKWKLMAEQDKLRYDVEKKNYTGSWIVRSDSTRKKRPKDAPKRPPSAFLNYCQRRRSELKKEYPAMKNTDISKLLGEEWKNAPVHIRKPHVEKERREREEYHEKVAIWRQKRKGGDTARQDQEGAFQNNTVHDGQIKEMLVKVPSSLSTLYPATNQITFQLSPREMVPSGPKEPETAKHSLSHKTNFGLEQIQAPSVRSWEDGISLQYDEIGESLIPTILPSTTDLPLSPSLYSSDAGIQDFLAAEGISAASKYGTPGMTFQSLSDGLNRHKNLDFTHMFQGDNAFDPPIT